MTWQPIKTAPREELILAWVPDSSPEICVLTFGWTDLPKKHPDYWEGWLYADDILNNHAAEPEPEPTHWMPLPEPPEAS